MFQLSLHIGALHLDLVLGAPALDYDPTLDDEATGEGEEPALFECHTVIEDKADPLGMSHCSHLFDVYPGE